jgi:hypothetical protein
MKQCKTCNEVKPFDLFHRDATKKDGRTNRCKDCVIKHVHAYRQSASGRTKQAEYKTSPERKAAYTRYNESSKGRATVHRYIRTSKAQERLKQYRAVHFKKVQAGNAVRNEVRYGRRPAASTLLCMYCGNPAHSYHHYKGYAKEHWFDVVPLCSKCHRKANRAHQE